MYDCGQMCYQKEGYANISVDNMQYRLIGLKGALQVGQEKLSNYAGLVREWREAGNKK